MKQKNYDVQQLYKEYMQGVTADRTAIDEILSGERRAAGTGARIKRSTGKMVGITAAAAAIAICAGVGLSHLNANDDSSIKSGANTSQTSSVLTPAKQITQSFKLEATSMTAAPLGSRTVLTLTATDEKGREIIQKYGSEDVGKNRIWLGGNESTQRPEIIDSTGSHHEWHDDCRVAKVSDDQMTFIYDTYLLFEAANEAMPFTVNVFCPDENKQPTADQIANGEQGNLSIIASAKLSYKVNAAEQVFTSANGEVFRVSDFYFYTNHDDKNNLSNLLFDMKFNFANSTQRSFVKQELSHLDQFGTDTLCIGGGYINGEYKLLHFFNDSINSDEVTSIIYDGITFNKVEEVNVEQARFKSEMTEMFASDHSLRVNVKLTALNDDAKKLLALDAKANASNGKTRIKADPINLDELPEIGGSTTTKPVINGDTLTTTVTFNRVNSSDTFKDGTKFDIYFPCTQAEGESSYRVPADRRLTVTVRKNVPERVFKSASGKTLWLTDYQFNCTMDASKLVGNALSEYQITFDDEYNPTKTQTSIPSLDGGGARSDKGDPNTHVSFIDKIDSSRVKSITYGGEVFTAQ